MIKAILFDLGDTVIENTDIDLGKGLRETLGDVIKDPNFAPIINDMITFMNRRSDLEYQIDEFFQRVENECHFKCPDDIEYQLFKASCQDQLMNGIKDVLEALKAQNYLTGIVSNSLFHQEILKKELEELGVAHYFNFILASANAKYRKSSPIIFDVAYHELLKFNPTLKKEEVLFIGDNLEFDYFAPLNYGFHALWFNRMSDKKDVPSINEMIQLISYLKEIK